MLFVANHQTEKESVNLQKKVFLLAKNGGGLG